MHVDVAVAAVATFVCDRVGDKRGPDLRSGQAVGGEAVVVLERHHGAADDLVGLARAPKSAEFGWDVPVAPVEAAGRCGDRRDFF